MNLSGAVKLKPVFKPKRYTTYVAILIAFAGVAGSAFAVITTQLEEQNYLIGRAQTIAATLPLEDVEKLKGNISDSSSPEYNQLKQRLIQIQNSNLDIKKIYIFSQKGDRIDIMADAKTPDSNGYVGPGTIYYAASDALRLTFNANRPETERLHHDFDGQFVAGYTPVYDTQSNTTVAAVGVYVDAKRYYLELALYALVPLLLAAIPFAGLLRDIRIQAKEHEIMQLKNQFISIASHELRSPLTGMLWGITSLQNDKKLSGKQKETLHDMFKSTESSLATVNEILDQSIFERQASAKLQRDIVDMISVLSQVGATLKLGATEKHIRIKPDPSWPAEALVLGDVGALKRASMNILSNAIKYSPDKSEINLGYRKSDIGEHIFTITDHGIGIPQDEQSKVMSGYYRASNASKVQAHGTGLGLWVTTKIIEDHGGRLWINSKEGDGTTVSIALPAKEFATPKQPAKSAA